MLENHNVSLLWMYMQQDPPLGAGPGYFPHHFFIITVGARL